MLPVWLTTLSPSFKGERASDLHLSDPLKELELCREQTVLAPLAHLGAIALTGEDTAAFLQGQLSSDVKEVDLETAQYSTYSTAKGRMLASFLLYRDAERHVLLPSFEIKDALQKRLSMFILRSKVKASDADLALFGLSGPQAESVLQTVLGVLPNRDLAVARQGDVSVIRLPHTGYLIAVPTQTASDYWQTLLAQAQPVGTAAWLNKEVNSGIVRITAQTQELFVPQMANFDLIGGVNFKKGCYPGQEIVARTQYLGKLKRRAYLATVDSAQPVEPGQPLYSPEFGEQATGHVANSAKNAEGNYDILVVINSSSIEHGVHLGSLDGPKLHFRQLPYTV